MKEKYIFFKGPMVRALLEGRKTQTRRLVDPQPPQPFSAQFPGADFGMCRAVADGIKMYSNNQYDSLPKHPTDWELEGSVGVARNAGFPLRYRCPYQVGQRLWVRETFQIFKPDTDEILPLNPDPGICVMGYKATEEERAAKYGNLFKGPWHPSIHMPRWASRITLEVTDIRVERIQDISASDALAEGITSTEFWNPKELEGRPFEEKWWDDFHFWNHYPQMVFEKLWSSLYGADSWESNQWVYRLGIRRVEDIK